MCSSFYFLKSTSKNTQNSEWPMGHSGDDVNHKISNKMKMHGQTCLKFLVLVYYKVFFRTRYKKDRYLSNAPLTLKERRFFVIPQPVVIFLR